MRRFFCDCGHPLFFDSNTCNNCGEAVGYDPVSGDMHTLRGANRIGSLFGAEGDFRYCQNGTEHGVCNWLIPADAAGDLCFGCQFNRTIPDVSRSENLERWHHFEQAKKRLLYSLHNLNLPLVNGWQDEKNGLLFDFIEDKRTNPVLPESFVSTGYLGGVITINVLEADDIERETVRTEMNESYRTLLGHMRHESGHYYYAYLSGFADLKAEFVRLFGDPNMDYQEALDRHYANGPVADWSKSYISSYAPSHPLEDWAECWSHYQHITDTLETASAYGMLKGEPQAQDFRSMAHVWRGLAVALNELNRSMGLGDAYPFVITERIENKLAFIDEVVNRLSQVHPEVEVR